MCNSVIWGVFFPPLLVRFGADLWIRLRLVQSHNVDSGLSDSCRWCPPAAPCHVSISRDWLRNRDVSTSWRRRWVSSGVARLHMARTCSRFFLLDLQLVSHLFFFVDDDNGRFSTPEIIATTQSGLLVQDYKDDPRFHFFSVKYKRKKTIIRIKQKQNSRSNIWEWKPRTKGFISFRFVENVWVFPGLKAE